MQTTLNTNTVKRFTTKTYTDAGATTGEALTEDRTEIVVIQDHIFDATARNFQSTVAVTTDHLDASKSSASVVCDPDSMTEAEAEEYAPLLPILNTLVDNLKTIEG